MLEREARAVTELLGERLTELYLIPLLLRYKDTVFNTLVEEENRESLNHIAEYLLSQQPNLEDTEADMQALDLT